MLSVALFADARLPVWARVFISRLFIAHICKNIYIYIYIILIHDYTSPFYLEHSCHFFIAVTFYFCMDTCSYFLRVRVAFLSSVSRLFWTCRVSALPRHVHGLPRLLLVYLGLTSSNNRNNNINRNNNSNTQSSLKTATDAESDRNSACQEALFQNTMSKMCFALVWRAAGALFLSVANCKNDIRFAKRLCRTIFSSPVRPLFSYSFHKIL